MSALSTKRLSLRPVTRTDVPFLQKHWNDTRVRRFLFDDRPVGRDQVAKLIACSEDSFVAHDYGLWILLKDDVLIGVCGLRPTDDGEVELLYSLEPTEWGHGLIFEAALRVLDHAFTVAGLDRVVAETDEDNAASARVAERLGMLGDAVRQGPYGSNLRFRISRTAWHQRA